MKAERASHPDFPEDTDHTLQREDGNKVIVDLIFDMCEMGTEGLERPNVSSRGVIFRTIGVQLIPKHQKRKASVSR